MIIRKSYQHKIGELGEKKKSQEIENNFLLRYSYNSDYGAIKHGLIELFLLYKKYLADDSAILYSDGYHLKNYPHQKEPKGTVVTLVQE